MTQGRKKCLDPQKKHVGKYSREYPRKTAKSKGKRVMRCPLCDPKGEQRIRK